MTKRKPNAFDTWRAKRLQVVAIYKQLRSFAGTGRVVTPTLTRQRVRQIIEKEAPELIKR